MRCAGHVARKGGRRGVYGVLVGKLRARDHLGDTGLDGRVILRWIFRSRMWGYGLDRAGSE